MIGLDTIPKKRLQETLIQMPVNFLAAAIQLKLAVGGVDSFAFKGEELDAHMERGITRVNGILADLGLDWHKPLTLAQIRDFQLRIAREIIETLEYA